MEIDNADVGTGRWNVNADAKFCITMDNSVYLHIILRNFTDAKFLLNDVRKCGCEISQRFESFSACEIIKNFAHSETEMNKIKYAEKSGDL